MEVMKSAPTTEDVYQGVYALYNNPDSAEKEKAAKWLESLQKSVSFRDLSINIDYLILAIGQFSFFRYKF